jgi:hypothetical protein
MVVIEIRGAEMKAFDKLVPFKLNGAQAGRWPLLMPQLSGDAYTIPTKGGPSIAVAEGSGIQVLDGRDTLRWDSMDEMVNGLINWLRDITREQPPELEISNHFTKLCSGS